MKEISALDNTFLKQKNKSSAIIPWFGEIFFFSKNFSFAWRFMAIFSISIGILLRTWQYLSNPSIWVDEAALARNILDRQVWQLLGPLDYGQLAPRGFLIGTKLIAMIFGYSEYVLRLIPFLSGLISLIMFFIAARLILRPVGAIVAMLMFSTAVPLIFFSSNLKPYSSDVAIALLILLITLWLRTHTLDRNNAGFLALTSLPLLFFSHAPVFLLTISGLVILADVFARPLADRWYRITIVMAWAMMVVIALAYNSLTMTAADHAYVYRFWLHAFMPAEHIPEWAWWNFQNIFGGTAQSGNFDGALHYPFPVIFACLTIVGVLMLCIESPSMAALLTGPFILIFIASAFHLYPFGSRLGLFLLPSLLLLIVAGLEKAGQTLRHFKPASYITVLLLPLVFIAVLQENFPRKPEHIRPVLQYVQYHWKAGDVLWVYYGAGQAFQYYQHLIPIRGAIYSGECNRAEPRAYLHQLDIVRGKPRVWILLVHGSGRFRFDERGLITNYLNTIGLQLDQFHAPPEDVSPDRAEVLLYDLSNAEKLNLTSASRFEIYNPFPPVLWACYSTMSPFEPTQAILDDLMAP